MWVKIDVGTPAAFMIRGIVACGPLEDEFHEDETEPLLTSRVDRRQKCLSRFSIRFGISTSTVCSKCMG